MASFLVLHGPNLNMLGIREPGIYGTTTLATIDDNLRLVGTQAGHQVRCLQSNAEHELVDAIQAAQGEGVNGIVFNPGAFTHTSVALRDALLAVDIPFFEVHLSNVHAREEFRRVSYLSDIAQAVITGLGPLGYEYALRAAFVVADA
jgi:3-dehydroquinate dehydratase-2